MFPWTYYRFRKPIEAPPDSAEIRFLKTGNVGPADGGFSPADGSEGHSRRGISHVEDLTFDGDVRTVDPNREQNQLQTALLRCHPER